MAGNEMLDQMNQLLKRAEPNAPMSDDDKEFFNSIYDSIIKSLRMEPGAAVSESDIIDSLRSLDPGSTVRKSEIMGSLDPGWVITAVEYIKSPTWRELFRFLKVNVIVIIFNKFFYLD